MKKFIYIFLAGLAAAGLASCEKQELKPTTNDVYSIVIEEDLQTKVSVSMVAGDKHTFYATLKKNGTPIDYSSFSWDYSPAYFDNLGTGTDKSKGYTRGTITLQAKAKVSSTNVSALSQEGDTGGTVVTGTAQASIKTISSITFTVASTSIVVGKSTTYTVKVNYSDNTTSDITSTASVSSSNSSMLSASSGNVQSYKKIGCLGTFTLTASYGGQTATKDVTVNTDYKSDDIVLNWSSDRGSGSESSGSVAGYVKRGDQSQCSYSFGGNLKTTNNDDYLVSDSLIEIYDLTNGVDNAKKVSLSFNDWNQDGNKETFELQYLGKAVKTWNITWYGN